MHTVCDMLCTTAVCLSQLSEVRGSVTVWRAYTSLIHQYHGALVTRLDLSSPMTALVNEIKDGLQTLASLPLKESTVVRSIVFYLYKTTHCRSVGEFPLIKNNLLCHRNLCLISHIKTCLDNSSTCLLPCFSPHNILHTFLILYIIIIICK